MATATTNQKQYLRDQIEIINACIAAFDEIKAGSTALGRPATRLEEAIDRLRGVEGDLLQAEGAIKAEPRMCEVCGNEYDKALKVEYMGHEHMFDSFECAIQLLAPRCAHCGCRIIGHGVEATGEIYCCAHCARKENHGELRDRAV